MVKNAVPGDRSSLSLAEFSPGVGQLGRGPRISFLVVGCEDSKHPFSALYLFDTSPLGGGKC